MFKFTTCVVCAVVVAVVVARVELEDATATATESLSTTTPEPSRQPITRLLSPISDVFGRRFIDRIRKEHDLRRKQLPPEQQLQRKYVQFAEDVREATSVTMSSLLPVAMSVLRDVDMSDECAASLVKFASALKGQKSWAMKLLDASGGIPKGLLSGSYSDFGNFEQCLSVASDAITATNKVLDSDLIGDDDSEAEVIQFHGQHCLMTLNAQLAVDDASTKTGRLAMTEHFLASMLKNTSAQHTVRKRLKRFINHAPK